MFLFVCTFSKKKGKKQNRFLSIFQSRFWVFLGEGSSETQNPFFLFKPFASAKKGAKVPLGSGSLPGFCCGVLGF
jgi:hypothetical protein